MTHNHLGLRRTQSDTIMHHWIRFDPHRNRIVRVQDDTASATREKTVIEYILSLRSRQNMARQTGVLIPTDDDYLLLHDELQRGSQFRSYDL